MKTGRLLRYACEAGAVLGNAQGEKYQALIDYSRRIGIASRLPTTFSTSKETRRWSAKS